ncbi:hypothetical protein J7E73_28190 [Paenibacillus albidus]|uniref:hypothetical protein n=1 Tax=Paenibacillus albidus TaxID=2041023 RepID=UPI001BE8B374|nr:hypothetical protein [Paenibacillus albidus]MBT2292926.1 hypothetical protein [Paenibacillus albidus]
MAKWIGLLLGAAALAGCGATGNEQVQPETRPKLQAATAVPEPIAEQTAEPCGAVIEWVDFLMINDIKYYQNYDGTKEVPAEQRGDMVGEVSYMLNEHACTNHVTQNGDAAFLPIGTEIYALKGYTPEFRVEAGGKIYEVKDNPMAATMEELFDINGKVQKVSLESGMDGSLIGDFSEAASDAFIHELLPLPYVGFDKVYEQARFETGVFLRVTLQDDTSFRMIYYPKANAFTAGAFGTESLKELIMTQRAQIKAAAGL